MIKVLIVEDDPMVAQINKSYVESLDDFRVIGIAKDESEALKVLSRENIDLIIIDIYLPKGDGVSLLSKIRTKHMQTDVIMVTAESDVEMIKKTLRLGAIDYLIKPFEYERLSQTLELYKVRNNIMANKRNISQGQLDQLFITELDSESLPKGLNAKTLTRIKKYIESLDKDFFCVDDISLGLDISKVTVRKYLDYLGKSNYLLQELEYGQVGRPSHIYKLIR